MEYIKNPKILQVELSSMCNALCLGCYRIDQDNFNRSHPGIPHKQFADPSVLKNLFLTEASKSVKTIEFCGTIDEPLMHPDFLNIIDMLAEIRPDLRITIHTNGSLRPVKFWQQLAHGLEKFRSYGMMFSIDGLADTNHIYRQNTSFDKIMTNASAFISAGGQAEWQYLIFDWNKHQVQEAKQLASDMGFTNFKTRNDRTVTGNYTLEEIRELQAKNQRYDGEYKFNLNHQIKSHEQYQDNEISCTWQEDSHLFITFDHRLWPCCFIADSTRTKTSYTQQRFYDNYGDDFNDLTKYNFDEILQHRFFKSHLLKSWNNDFGLGETDKIFKCAKTCSKRALAKNPLYNHNNESLN
jgi:MoaA/NifB/PqqE/SkfB family radical SAM enzyme